MSFNQPEEEEGKHYHSVEGEPILRRATSIETEVRTRKDSAIEFLGHTTEAEQVGVFSVSQYVPPFLADAIFCGHLVTDLDR
jgi:hypothetical protein